MLSSFIDRLLGRDITKTRTRKNRRQEGRANLRKELSRQLNLEHLEDRRLLTTYVQGEPGGPFLVHTTDSYYDSGNVDGNYLCCENSTITFGGVVGTQVRAAFSLIQLASSWVGPDVLTAFNGPSTVSPVLGAWTGSPSVPQTVQSTSLPPLPPQLTFHFGSQLTSPTEVGWAATLYVINTDRNPVINAGGGDNLVTVQVDSSQRDLTNVFIDGSLVDTFETAKLDSMTINGEAGDDRLTVDLTYGSPLPSSGLRFDGGLGFDGLVLQNGSVTSDTYSPGANPGDGRITLVGVGVGGSTQTVSFQNIEPVIDTLIAPTFSIASVPGIASLLDASNAINYTQSQLISIAGVLGGRVTVDNFEPIEFTNKAKLVIDAGAGSDTISLNNPTTPTAPITPTGGLTSVFVNGGGGSDTVTVTGQASVVDSVVYTPTGADSGKLEVLEVVGLKDIQLTGVDRLIYNGQNKRHGTLVESLKVMLPGAATNLVDYEFDSVSFIGSVAVNSNGQPLLPVQFQNIAYTASSGNGIVIDGNAEDGDDRLFYGGRSEWDHIVVDRNGLINDLPLALPVQTPGVERLVLLGRGGDDVFDVAADHPYAEVIVTGGSAVTASNPDSSGDLIVLRAASGERNRAETITVTPNLYTAGETYIKGTGRDELSTFSTMGVGRIYYVGSPTLDNTPVPDDTLVVDPGLGTHTVRVDAGRFTGSTASPLVMPGPYDRVTSDSLPQVQGHGLETLRIAPVRIDSLLTGSVAATFVTGNLTQAAKYEAALAAKDTLIIEGNDGSADNYTVTGATETYTLAVADGTSGKTVTATLATLGRLQINTLGGDDKVTVDVDGTDLITVPITFDGGTGSDQLTVQGKPAVDVEGVPDYFTTQASYTPGPLGNQGRLVEVGVGASTKTMTIDFANLEPVVDLIPGILWVNGTNADNAINYTAGTNNGDGVWRGAVSVDGFETIDFTNKTTLTIDGLAGNDTVIINGTTGDDNVTITPSAAYAADITTRTTVPEQIPVVAQIKVATTESLIYNGQEGADDLTVEAPGTRVITHTPGAQIDAGKVQVDSWLPISYGSLGATGTVTIDGVEPSSGIDTLVAYGTGANDTFSVLATTGAVDLRTSLGNHVRLLQTQVLIGGVLTNTVEKLVLNGLAGDDTFNVNAAQLYTDIAVNGGEPSASDVLNLIGTEGVETMIVNLGDVTADTPTPTTIDGFGGTVTLDGVEHVNMVGNKGKDTLTVNGTANDDQITYQPKSALGGNFSLANLNTAFSFTVGTAASFPTLPLLPFLPFTIHGSGATGGDQVNVVGPNAGSTFIADEHYRFVLVSNAAGVDLMPVQLDPAPVAPALLDPLTAIQTVNLLAGIGNNTFLVAPDQAILLPGATDVVGPRATGFRVPNNLLVNVVGNGAASQNALVVAAYNPATGETSSTDETLFAVVNRTSNTAGVVRVFKQTVLPATQPRQFPDISYQNVGIVYADTATDLTMHTQQTLTLGPDLYAPNGSLNNAAFLGSGSAINVTNLAIFPNAVEHRFLNAEQDWFRVVAQSTGTLDFQVYFTRYQGFLPGNGQLQIQVYDAVGNQIGHFGVNDQSTDERRRVPVVAGETYYLQVYGVSQDAALFPNNPLVPDVFDSGNATINAYSLTITNTAAPKPDSIGLNNVLAYGKVNAAPAPTATSFTASNADTPPAPTQPLLPLSILTNFYVGKYLNFTSGTLQGQRQLITAYAPATHTFTFAAGAAFSAAPAANDTFQIESTDTGRTQFDNVTRDNTPTVYIRLDAASPTVPLGLVNAVVAPTTTTLSASNDAPPVASLSPVAGYYVGRYLEFTSGALIGQQRLISSYTLPDGVPTFVFAAFGGAPAVNDGFRIDFFPSDNWLADLQGGGSVPSLPPNSTVIPIPIPFWAGDAVSPPYSPDNFGSYRVAVYDQTNPLSPAFMGYANRVAGQTGVFQLDLPALIEGSHTIVARVEMDSPSKANDLSLADNVPFKDVGQPTSFVLIVDTLSTVPYFGLKTQADVTQGLATASDSGVNGYPATNIDRVTNVTTPTFFGTAEANNIVRLYVENGKAVGLQTSGADADIFLGQTVANPLDGTNQFPRGQWTITSSLDLNNPNLEWRTDPTNFYAKDGLRKIYVTAEDLAGNVTPDQNLGTVNADFLNIFLDTAGPQVTRVAVNDVGNSYNLWGLKSTTPPILVPTPLVYSLVISVQDLPIRRFVDTTSSFLYSALFQGVANLVGHYHLVGDANGVIPIQSVLPFFTATDVAGVALTAPAVAEDGELAYGYVTLTFANPLPDDRFTLTIDDDIGDPAGNRLDGESHTVEPQGDPTLPSGNLVPGGSFVARFTVDSRPELGVVAAGSVWVDTNGNSQWDATNVDYTNRDLTYAVQYTDGTGLTDRFVTTDDVFAGNFGATQVATIVAPGVPGASETGTTVTITTAADHGLVVGQQVGINGVAVAGYNGLFLITGVPTSTTFTYTTTAGLPPSGNGTVFANDGYSKLAAYGRIGNEFRWLVDTNNDGVAEKRQVNTDIGGTAMNINGRPIAWNFDGNAANGDEVGLMAGQTWYLDVNHTYNTRDTLDLPLLPPGLPVVGDFDGNGQVDFGTWRDDLFTIYLNPTLPASGQPSAQHLSESIASHVKTISFGFIGTRERPVAADMDMDGITDLGLWVPDRTGTVPQGSGEWYWLMSNKLKATREDRLALVGTVNALNHPFSEVPLGHDLHAVFGDQFAVPVVGNFDPPVAASGAGAVLGHRNPKLAADVSGDNVASALDALLLINEINANQSHVLTGPVGSVLFPDPNGDGAVTASDVLYVVNYVNTQAAGVGGEGEGFVTPAPVTAAASPAAAPVAPAATVPAWRTAASVSQPVSAGLVVGSAAADQALQVLDDEGLLTRLAADVGAAQQDDFLEDLVFEELGG